jgi:hypothetical protein
VPVTRGSVAGRAVIDRQTIHICNVDGPPSESSRTAWPGVSADGPCSPSRCSATGCPSA